MIADLDIHDQNIKMHEQRKKANATAMMNESMMTSNINNAIHFDVTRSTI